MKKIIKLVIIMFMSLDAIKSEDVGSTCTPQTSGTTDYTKGTY
jgi:hypothetical protein